MRAGLGDTLATSGVSTHQHWPRRGSSCNSNARTVSREHMAPHQSFHLFLGGRNRERQHRWRPFLVCLFCAVCSALLPREKWTFPAFSFASDSPYLMAPSMVCWSFTHATVAAYFACGVEQRWGARVELRRGTGKQFQHIFPWNWLGLKGTTPLQGTSRGTTSYAKSLPGELFFVILDDFLCSRYPERKSFSRNNARKTQDLNNNHFTVYWSGGRFEVLRAQDKRPASRRFNKLSGFGNSSLSWRKKPQSTSFCNTWCDHRGAYAQCRHSLIVWVFALFWGSN